MHKLLTYTKLVEGNYLKIISRIVYCQTIHQYMYQYKFDVDSARENTKSCMVVNDYRSWVQFQQIIDSSVVSVQSGILFSPSSSQLRRVL